MSVLRQQMTEDMAVRGLVPSRSMFGIRVYAMHEIYTFISRTRLCRVPYAHDAVVHV